MAITFKTIYKATHNMYFLKTLVCLDTFVPRNQIDNLGPSHLRESSLTESLLWGMCSVNSFALSHFTLQQTSELCAISSTSQIMKLGLK